jgi:hypothetical protein
VEIYDPKILISDDPYEWHTTTLDPFAYCKFPPEMISLPVSSRFPNFWHELAHRDRMKKAKELREKEREKKREERKVKRLDQEIIAGIARLTDLDGRIAEKKALTVHLKEEHVMRLNDILNIDEQLRFFDISRCECPGSTYIIGQMKHSICGDELYSRPARVAYRQHMRKMPHGKDVPCGFSMEFW